MNLQRWDIWAHGAVERDMEDDGEFVYADEAIAALAAKDARIKELEEECERERLRLAACGVAAMSNTERTIENRRLPEDNPYYSASYSDVVRMVEREISQRDRIKELEDALRMIKANSYYCNSCSASLYAEEALEQFDEIKQEAK